jgi:hypothetical protein
MRIKSTVRTVPCAVFTGLQPEGARLTEPQISHIWHDAAGPAGLPVAQVYCRLCPVTGQVLIQNTTTASAACQRDHCPAKRDNRTTLIKS